jgi:hypothetical protein
MKNNSFALVKARVAISVIECVTRFAARLLYNMADSATDKQMLKELFQARSVYFKLSDFGKFCNFRK